MQLPGHTPDGAWDLPTTLNMADQCLDHPDGAVAIIDLTHARKDITFGALRQMVDGLAHALRARITGGDRVGVLRSQSPWCLAAHLAIWKVGAISVPLFKLFKHDALATRLGDAGCQLVITDKDGVGLIGGLATPLVPEDMALDLRPAPTAQTAPDTPAILIYTSGTTGKPKGALHGHRILTGHLPGVVVSHDYLGQPGDVLWTPADWAWIGGLFDVALAGLALGVPVVAGPTGKFDPPAVRALCASAGVRNVFFPPTALRMLKASGVAIPGLRSVASGGEPLGAQMLEWGRQALGLTINEFYGQTECNMVASSCAADFAPRPGCIGKAVPGFEITVLDGDGQPTEGEGDVAIRKGAASMMLGYWNQPEATDAKFNGDWMITGDRGAWDGDYLRFVGREDDVITSSGYRIGPAEIEDCLLTHPDVVTCGVVGKPDPLRTEIVKAYVVVRPRSGIRGKDLQAWVKSRLSTHAYPREIEFLQNLPMTITGKVIRKELKARARAET